MLFQHRLAIHNPAPIALHAQVETWVIVLNRCEAVPNVNICIQFFFDLPHQGLLRSFARFDLSAGEFPAVLIIAISTLCGKYLVAIPDDGRNNFYCLHVFSVTQKA